MSNEDIIDNNSVKLLHKIVAEANKDDVLTDDEKEIIKTIEMHLWDLENEVELAMEAGKNTPELMELIKEQLHNILKRAEEKANEDGKITEDEKALLDTLDKYVNSDNITGLLSEYLDMFV